MGLFYQGFGSSLIFPLNTICFGEPDKPKQL